MHVSYTFCPLKLNPDTVTVEEQEKRRPCKGNLDLLDTM